MEIIIGIISVVVLILLSLPITLSFLGGALIYVFLTGVPSGQIASGAFYSVNKFSLLAIPLFLLAGELMERGGIAEKLIDFASSLLAKVKGGMGMTIPVACGFFGALSGSGTAAVAALGKIMIPRLEELGWDRRYTAAFMAAAGPLSYMIPPNMSAIVFAVVAQASVAALFLATVIPAIIWIALYIAINQVVYKNWFNPTEEHNKLYEKPYLENVKKSIKPAVPAFIMPIIILGGIYSGIFTPTEAGAVACVYALLIGIFLYKRIKYKNAFKVFSSTGKTIGAILIIFPFVTAFTRYLVMEGVPQRIAMYLTTVSSGKIGVILLMNLIFVVSGMFLSPGVLVLVITPLLMPTANAIGLHTIQLGTILFVAIGIGSITPPMAMDLFVATRVSGVEMQDMLRPLWPFLIFGAIPVLLLVSFIPSLSLWLPSVVMGITF